MDFAEELSCTEKNDKPNARIFLVNSVFNDEVMGTRLLIFILVAGVVGIVCGCGHRDPAAARPVQPEQRRQHEEPVEAASLPDVNDGPQGKRAPAVSFNENLAEFLSCYVDDNGMVDYKKLRPKRLELIQALREFDQLSPKEYDSWPVPEKVAFWINAYNLCTIKVIIDNYPIKASRYMTLFYPANSIRQISKPWTKYEFSIMQVEYTLREIERRILLRQFDESRVCFALSYASMGGPRLRNEPYTGEKLEKQLDEQVRSFIENKRGFRIDREEEEVYLSAIFKWYADVLGGKFAANKKFVDQEPDIRTALNFISNYVSRADRDFLERKAYSVKYIRYDWALNEQ